jgi:tetratricopeptide (TPR) repeat protein
VNAAQKNGDKALELINSAVETFKDLKNPLGQASALKVALDLKLAEGRYYHALLVAEDMIKLYSGTDDAQGEAAANLLAADIQVVQGDLQAAMDLAASAAELFDQVGNNRKKASAILVMAKAFKQSGQGQDAVYACEAAKALFQKGRDKTGQAEALVMQAQCHLAENEFANAAKRFEEAAFVYRSLKDKLGEARALAAQVDAQVQMCKSPTQSAGVTDEHYEQAAKTAARAAELFGDGSSETGRALLSQAALYTMLKRPDETLAKSLEALQLFEAIGDMSGQADAYIAIGNAYLAKDNKEAALETMEKARDLAEEAGEGASIKEASNRLKEIGRYKGRKGKSSGGDTGKMDLTYVFDGDKQPFHIDQYEGRAMRTGKPMSSSSGAAGDKGWAARKKVMYNLRMQRVPNVDMTTMPIEPIAA